MKKVKHVTVIKLTRGGEEAAKSGSVVREGFCEDVKF